MVRMSKEMFKHTPNWVLESTDRFYYLSGRNSTTYMEISYFYDPVTCERKETVRSETISDGEEYKLPTWAKSVTEHRKSKDEFRYM